MQFVGRHARKCGCEGGLTMCGIAGIFEGRTNSSLSIADSVNLMGKMLVHRGPDSSGIWSDQSQGIALSHQRLAILDLSSSGSQPMTSHCGRFVLVFNGEIYNHLILRKNIACHVSSSGHVWRGHSDTETLLAHLSIFGLSETLDQLTGMFAFALWDIQEQSLTLARDRMGEKPLYYGLVNGALIFGSELKAIRAYPNFKAEINRSALAGFMMHSYVSAPYSIFKDIYKLPAGSVITITRKDVVNNVIPTPQQYWSINNVASAGLLNPFEGDFVAAQNQLEELLLSAIQQQMLSDVPLGAFLSGGIDSTIVVAMMQYLSNNPVQTFTIGFNEQGFDEAVYAKKVAQHLNTDHTELYVSPIKAMEIIPTLNNVYDEPFADISQIPTVLVSQLAKQSVQVCLSGDGGDELFGGYNRHISGPKIWKNARHFPLLFRKIVAEVLQTIPPHKYDSFFNWVGGFSQNVKNIRSPGEKLYKVSSLLNASSSQDVYSKLIQHWHNVDDLVLGIGGEAFSNTSTFTKEEFGLSHQMMLADSAGYLPDDILVKLDRASMICSLETRVPLLDRKVIEFAWTLPLDMKIQQSHGKIILKEILGKYVPRQLVDRPKAGFSVPMDQWLRDPLKEWANYLLQSEKIKNQGYLNHNIIQNIWQQHLSGRFNHGSKLWNILMFQAWLNDHKI